MTDRSCMSYWFPRIAGLSVPRTGLMAMPRDVQRDIYAMFDGAALTYKSTSFFDELRAAVNEIGLPCFLRSGHTSAKHGWKRTCYLTDASKLEGHVFNIIEYGELSSLMGLPFDWWAVREYLPVTPIAICHAWGNMPVCREFRVFVRDAVVQCWHPYWPLHALKQGGAIEPAVAYAQLIECADETGLLALASKAGAACGGYWSVDIMDTARGWVITDMAEGEKSYHWESCEKRRAA